MAEKKMIDPQDAVNNLLLALGMTPEKVKELAEKPRQAVEDEYKGSATLQIGKGWFLKAGAGKFEHALTHLPEIVAFYMKHRGNVAENPEVAKKAKAYMKLVAGTAQEVTMEQAIDWAKATMVKA